MRKQTRQPSASLGIYAALLFALIASAARALTDSWSVDVAQNTAVQRTYKQGETWDIQIEMRDGLRPLDMTGATARFFWYTNSADNVWWTNSAIVTGSLIKAAWTPAMDVGASMYPYWIGVWPPGSDTPLWRANGTIRVLPSPGFAPNHIMPPVQYIDFAKVAYTNAPWLTPADLPGIGTGGAVESVNGETGRVVVSAQSINALTNELDEAALFALAEYARTNRVTRWQDATDPNVWLEFRGGTSIVTMTTMLVPSTMWAVASDASIVSEGAVVLQGPFRIPMPEVPFPLPSSSAGSPARVFPVSEDSVFELLQYDANSIEVWFTPNVSEVAKIGRFYNNTMWVDAGGSWGYSTQMVPENPKTTPNAIRLEALQTNANVTVETVYDLTKIGKGGGNIDDLEAAARAAVNRYLVSSNAWMEISGPTLTVWRVVSATNALGETVSVSTNKLWESSEAAPSEIDPDFVNAVWTAIIGNTDAIAAITPWGKTAPDGTPNPDPQNQTIINNMLSMIGGLYWISSGGYAVLATSGTVAFEHGGTGAARVGPDIARDWFGYETGGSVVVGAVANGITVENAGTLSGRARITYRYAGGDYPAIFYTPDLLEPFEPVADSDAEWTDNGNGTATVSVPATGPRGFWRGSTTATYRANFVSTMPAELRGGIYGTTNAPPVIYDSVISVQSGGRSYLIPAQALGAGDEP
jgi:hypothetical protein